MLIAQTFTACDAHSAHKASGKATQQRERIFNFIASNTAMDWSIGEVAHFLGLEKSTVSARINELLADESLEAKPNRKDRRSGVTVRPVGLVVVGQKDLF